MKKPVILKILINFSILIVSLNCVAQAQEMNKETFLKSCLVNMDKDVAMAGDDAALKQKVHDNLIKKCACYANNMNYRQLNNAIQNKDNVALINVEAKAKYLCNQNTQH